MIVHTNTMSSIFAKAEIDVKYKLFKCYSMSFYGSPLWDMSNKCISRVYTTWRKCLRKLLCLPSRTHCDLLPLICNDLPVSLQLCIRFVKFITGALNSKNECVKVCAMSALNGSRSSACNNINHIAHMLTASKYIMVDSNSNCIIKSLKNLFSSCEQQKITAFQIRDLVYLRSVGHINFSKNDFTTMIDYLCCK